MCNATPTQTPILQSINTYSIGDLENFLNLHNFELSCFLKHGINSEKLNAINMELLKKQVSKEGITKERLLESGMTQTKIDEIFDSTPPPIGVTCPACQKTFATEDELNNFKQHCSSCADTTRTGPGPSNDYYEQIRNNDFRVTAKTIKDWLNVGLITKDGLINNCGLSNEITERLAAFETKFMDDNAINVNQLPPLKSDRTDFYFLGMPTAGKSCLVASLLAYWDYTGIYNPDVNNPRSLEYTTVLLEPFENGYLPNRTETGFLDYINCSLDIRIQGSGIFGRGETTRSIPINILDMAGESWRIAAEKGSGLPDHRRYLENKNEKAIVIVIDSSATQTRNIVRIFKYFEEWGIWEKTASVVVVVAKADKLSTTADYHAMQVAAENYYNSSTCLNLKNRIDDLARKHGFEVSVLPYSIGECRFGQFLMNPNFETNRLLQDSASNLNQWILENTGGKNSGGFGGIFSN
jgi:hypothetical protein